MIDWDDLRHLLAIGRHGSTNAAARTLGVSQSTVQRRIAALESRTARPLVLRTTAGYTLTPLGKELLPLAEQVATAVDAFERKVRGTAPDGRQIIRLTCPEPVVGRLRPLIERFYARCPAYKVEFVTSDRYLDLLQGDADVAFRSGDTDAALIGRKVAESAWGLYASSAYVARCGSPASAAELASHPVLALDESMAGHRLMTWLKRHAPHADVASRSTSILGLVEAARSGIGVAPLPIPVAKQAGLVELFAPIPELARDWRLLTHPALRNAPRIAAFFDFVEREKAVVRSIFG